MHKIGTLSNGLSVITVDIPYLNSVTTLVAVGAGSRCESKNTRGISHFLEHMFFKGSEKYPTAEVIATIVEGAGAVNNAATSKEYTYYWIKSGAKYVPLACDLLSSQIRESLFKDAEIEREKGVIIEERRSYQDSPSLYVWSLFERLQYGDQPLGWDVIGEESTVGGFTRENLTGYIDSFYAPSNMALVFAGKLPEDIMQLAEKYFGGLPEKRAVAHKPFVRKNQVAPKVNMFYKKTDQANLVLGVEGYSRRDPKKYGAVVLGLILGGGMSSRLFLEVRERRGLAYHVGAGHEAYLDTGAFVAYAGLKLEKTEEGLKVLKDELQKLALREVPEEELKKVKEMERGRLALKSESTNFLAEYFGIKRVLDGHIETMDEYLGKIDAVTAEDVKKVAEDLFIKSNFNLQIISPRKDGAVFTKILLN